MARDPLAARAAFLEAGAFFARLVADVEELAEHSHDDVWARPGLGAWDVRALTGHTSRALVTLATYLGTPATEELCTSTGRYYALAGVAADPEEVAARGVAAGRELGDEPVAAVHAALENVRAALAGVPVGEDPLIRTLVGGTRLSAYLPTRTFELAVHGLDLATACGVDRIPPEPVLADAALTAVEIAVERDQVPEGLLALTGRRPLPPGFSLLS